MIDESVTALSAAVEDPSDGINEMLSTVGLITFLSFSHYSYVTYAFTSLSLSQVDSLSEDITNIETLIQKIAKNYKIPLPKEST